LADNSDTRKDLERKRVLLVEDHEPTRWLVASRLRDAGLLVDEAESLAEAIDWLDRRVYHVAVVDVLLVGDDPKAPQAGSGLAVLDRVNDTRAEIFSPRKRIVLGTG
jgi:DNA-binding NtrC family response regulator